MSSIILFSPKRAGRGPEPSPLIDPGPDYKTLESFDVMITLKVKWRKRIAARIYFDVSNRSRDSVWP